MSKDDNCLVVLIDSSLVIERIENWFHTNREDNNRSIIQAPNDILFLTLLFPPDYHTNAMTSPPTLRERAFLPVMMPFDVDTIATPSPFITRGISSQLV